MKKFIKALVLCIVLCIFPTVVACFIEWDLTLLNPSTWETGGRAIAIVWYTAVIIISYIYYIDI